MKLHLSHDAGLNLVTAYGDAFLEINTRRHGRSLVVMPTRLLPAWPVLDFAELNAAHFNALLELAPEMVLLGTGLRQRFPHPALYAALTEARIGLDVMDTGAACRTYNILAAEGRQVAAALIIESGAALDDGPAGVGP